MSIRPSGLPAGRPNHDRPQLHSMLAPSGALGSGVAERSSIASLTPSPHNPDGGAVDFRPSERSPPPSLTFRHLDPVAQAAEPRDEESTPSRVRMAVHPCHRATDVALRLAVPATPRATSTPGIRATIAGRDGVDVETVDVVALRPRLNDLTVTVDASIRLARALRSTISVRPSGSTRRVPGSRRRRPISVNTPPTDAPTPTAARGFAPSTPNNTTMTRDHPLQTHETPRPLRRSGPARPRALVARDGGARRDCRF